MISTENNKWEILATWWVIALHESTTVRMHKQTSIIGIDLPLASEILAAQPLKWTALPFHHAIDLHFGHYHTFR